VLPLRSSLCPHLLSADPQASPLLAHVEGAEGPEEQRRRLRTELVRWHPDKFVAKFGRRLAAGDRERVLERVNALSQQLNAIGAALQQAR
jgi:triphosphoribosyl-dephospho-CoA synthetase